METQQMFEKATRNKLRFMSGKGNLIIEELWDLSLRDLDRLAQSINAELKETKQESFIPDSATEKRGSTTLNLKLDLVKYIIEVRYAERELADLKKELAELKRVNV